MCEGVPVIGTPNGFAKDTITDWYNGFLVKFGDVAELSARMEHFIRQPYLSNTLGQNAIAAAKELMGSWRFIEKHLKCYFDCESSPKDEIMQNLYYHTRKLIFTLIASADILMKQ